MLEIQCCVSLINFSGIHFPLVFQWLITVKILIQFGVWNRLEWMPNNWFRKFYIPFEWVFLFFSSEAIHIYWETRQTAVIIKKHEFSLAISIQTKAHSSILISEFMMFYIDFRLWSEIHFNCSEVSRFQAVTISINQIHFVVSSTDQIHGRLKNS